MIKRDNRIWAILKNKYVIATIIFVVYVFFLSENNLRVVGKVRSEVKELTEQEELLKAEIHQDSVNILQLSNNIDAIEEYGREQYYMKANNEDVYVVKEKEGR